MGSSSEGRQTVKLGIDCETGELIHAEALLVLPEEEFSTLRRQAMTTRGERRRGAETMRFQCAICRQPLFLSRRIGGRQNRWFVHDGKSEQCPWYEGNRLTPDQVKALVYRGQQEGREHREAKQFIANWLALDPTVSAISQEQTTFSAALNGEWRRPDVKCLYRGTPLVFEIQLSYTFLSDVIARDAFYKREGIFIIWVFARFDRSRAAVVDEAFFNRRNLFVLDECAKQQTLQRKSLTFSGYRQTPVLLDDQIVDEWSVLPICLDGVTFPTDTMRPYFFDYNAERKKQQFLREAVQRRAQKAAWRQSADIYLAAAERYYESGYGDDAKAEMLGVVDHLYDQSAWHRGLESLRSERFYGYHRILPVLLSIQRGRSLGYSNKFSVYQVMEAGLRSGSRVGQHAFAILYLWAYKIYLPKVSSTQRKWLVAYGHKIKQSLDVGEDTYRRDTDYDETIGALFPELDELLATPFGTDMRPGPSAEDEGAEADH